MGTLLRVLATEHLARYVPQAADRPEDPGKLIKFIRFAIPPRPIGDWRLGG